MTIGRGETHQNPGALFVVVDGGDVEGGSTVLAPLQDVDLLLVPPHHLQYRHLVKLGYQVDGRLFFLV
jgi:hypothetical protein